MSLWVTRYLDVMYDERVCAWGLTGGHLVVSRLVRKTKSSSRFFWLLPVSLFCGREPATLLLALTPPFPNIFNTSPSVALLSSFPSLFFFFLLPPPSSSFSAPRRLLGPALLAVHSLCFSRSSTTFLYPPLPPKLPTSPPPCAPFTRGHLG